MAVASPRAFEQRAEAHACDVILGAQLDRALECRDGAVDVVGRLIGPTEIVLRDRVLGRQRAARSSIATAR